MLVFFTTDGFQTWHKKVASIDPKATAHVSPGNGLGMSNNPPQFSHNQFILSGTKHRYSASLKYVNLEAGPTPFDVFTTSSSVQRSYGGGGMNTDNYSFAYNSTFSSTWNQSMPLIAKVGQYHSPVTTAFADEDPQSIREPKSVTPRKQKMDSNPEDWGNTDENSGDPLPIGTSFLPLLIFAVIYGAVLLRHCAGQDKDLSPYL